MRWGCAMMTEVISEWGGCFQPSFLWLQDKDVPMLHSGRNIDLGTAGLGSVCCLAKKFPQPPWVRYSLSFSNVSHRVVVQIKMKNNVCTQSSPGDGWDINVKNILFFKKSITWSIAPPLLPPVLISILIFRNKEWKMKVYGKSAGLVMSWEPRHLLLAGGE